MSDTPPEPTFSDPASDGTRYLGTGLIRSGDQGMLIGSAGRGLQNVVVALVRAIRLGRGGITPTRRD